MCSSELIGKCVDVCLLLRQMGGEKLFLDLVSLSGTVVNEHGHIIYLSACLPLVMACKFCYVELVPRHFPVINYLNRDTQLTLRGGWQKSLCFSAWLSVTFNTHGLHLCTYPNARVCVFLAFHNHAASRSLAHFHGASTHTAICSDRKSFIFNESWRFMAT